MIETTNDYIDMSTASNGPVTRDKTHGNPQTISPPKSSGTTTGLRKKDTVKEILHNSESWLRPARNDKRIHKRNSEVKEQCHQGNLPYPEAFETL